MDGFTSGSNGCPQTEQHFRSPSANKCGGSVSFAIPTVYAVRRAVQCLWKSNYTTTLTGIMEGLSVIQAQIAMQDRIPTIPFSGSPNPGDETLRLCHVILVVLPKLFQHHPLFGPQPKNEHENECDEAARAG